MSEEQNLKVVFVFSLALYILQELFNGTGESAVCCAYAMFPFKFCSISLVKSIWKINHAGYRLKTVNSMYSFELLIRCIFLFLQYLDLFSFYFFCKQYFTDKHWQSQQLGTHIITGRPMGFANVWFCFICCIPQIACNHKLWYTNAFMALGEGPSAALCWCLVRQKV